MTKNLTVLEKCKYLKYEICKTCCVIGSQKKYFLQLLFLWIRYTFYCLASECISEGFVYVCLSASLFVFFLSKLLTFTTGFKVTHFINLRRQILVVLYKVIDHYSTISCMHVREFRFKICVCELNSLVSLWLINSM